MSRARPGCRPRSRDASALWTGVVALAVAATPAWAAGDFDPSSNAWNGLSELGALGGTNTALRPSARLRWPAQGAVVVINPAGELDVDDVRRFLEGGGRLVLADDFGRSDALLAAFGMVRGPVEAAEAFGGNPALAVARPVGTHDLLAGVDRVITNHPSALAGGGRPLLTFAGTGRHLVVETRVGQGSLLALSDPSVLINNMLEVPENRRFAGNLLRWACGGTDCTVALHVAPGAEPEPVPATAAGGLSFDPSRLDKDVLWLVSVAVFGLSLLLLLGFVPGGGEVAWADGGPPSERPRPDPFALRVRALAAAGEDGDGRLLAAIVGARARRALGRHASSPEAAVLFTRLARQPWKMPGGLAGLAGVLQDVEEAPLREDPYEPGRRRWTVGEALRLHHRVRALEARLSTGGDLDD